MIIFLFKMMNYVFKNEGFCIKNLPVSQPRRSSALTEELVVTRLPQCSRILVFIHK